MPLVVAWVVDCGGWVLSVGLVVVDCLVPALGLALVPGAPVPWLPTATLPLPGRQAFVACVAPDPLVQVLVMEKGVGRMHLVLAARAAEGCIDVVGVACVGAVCLC